MSSSKKIFPHEFVENSVEQHFQEFNPRTRKLYLILIGVLVLFFLMMFIIRVDISVRSTGVIKPTQGRTDIKSAIEGVVDSVFVTENQHVKAGQPIIKIHSQYIDEKNKAVGGQRNELRAELNDLTNLLAGKTDSLTSSVYTQGYTLYQQKLNDANVRYTLVKNNYNRYAALYRKRVISAAEYDRYNYERRSVESEINLIKEQQYNQWVADRTRLQSQLGDMGSALEGLEEQQDLHTIKASVNGSVQQLKAVQPGSIISANEVLGEISPDSGLIAEAYVSPKDIAYLSKGTPIRMQIDAFNYNMWGMAEGTVESISSDIFNDEGAPYFKVRCKVNSGVLQLRNGYKGYIKKGMTIQARFLIARRSLFQLLYDKTDDWLNPNTVTNGIAKQ